MRTISTYDGRAKLWIWAKQVTITGFAQVLIQVFSLVSGILVIRLLSTTEYAWYTLANTMLGTMTILADGGIATAVFALGGQSWKSKAKLGTVVKSGLKLRNRFAAFSLLISIPILLYLLILHEASWLTAILIVLSLIPAFLAALKDSIYEIVPKLHQDLLPLQQNQSLVGLARLFLSALLLFIFPWAFVGILAAGIPRIVGNIKLRSIVGKFADLEQYPNSDVESNILSTVRRIFPGAVYYCISGQISLWLISFFGSSTSLAEIGALGRIAIMLNLISVMFATLVIPRFSRINADEGDTVKRNFLFSIAAAILILLLVVLFSYVFDNQVLSLLGDAYVNLNSELHLLIIGSSIATLAGIATTLIRSRGHIINPWIGISASLLAIVTGAMIFEVSSLLGVIYFNIWIASIDWLVNLGYALIVLKSKYSLQTKNSHV